MKLKDYKTEEDLIKLVKVVKELSESNSIVHYHKELKPKKKLIKKFGDIGKIEKRSRFQARIGVNYEDVVEIQPNTDSNSDRPPKKPTMEKIADGVYRNRNTNSLFIGSQPIVDSGFKNESNYYLDGEKIDLDTIIVEDNTFADFLYAADLPKDSNNNTKFQYLKIKNIEEIK